MKLIVGLLFVTAAVLAMPMEDEDRCENHASPEVCLALLPMNLDSLMDEDAVSFDEDEESKRQLPPTDDILEKLIWEKLKIFAWIIGTINPGAGQFVRQFIEQHRDEVTKALAQGGHVLIGLLLRIVGGAATLG